VKAISPVIATVILVAVAIALSIAIALWITGMTAEFTGVEKLEVVNAYAEVKTTTDNKVYWEVTIKIKNTGTKAVTVDGIFINNKVGEISKVTYTIGTSSPNTGSFTLDPGQEATLTFNLKSSKDITTVESPSQDEFTSGQTVSIVIHTASGGQYPTTVTLP